MMAIWKAHCDAGGTIEFTDKRVPAGSLSFFRAATEALCREQVEPTARHSYDGKTLLVPGVPEAANQRDGMTALIAHREWLYRRLGVKLNEVYRGTK